MALGIVFNFAAFAQESFSLILTKPKVNMFLELITSDKQAFVWLF